MNSTSLTLSLLTLLALSSAALANPEVPGAKQAGPIALTGATVHPVSGPAIEEATIVFNNGRIIAVGKNVKVPANAETIDLAGQHVYPALFDANTELGLVEVSAVRATVDVRETGSINPNVRALVAVNPDSEIIPVTRSNGVLLALVAPHGDLVAGRSAVVALDGWTWEDMALKADAALHITWPRIRASRRSDDDDGARQGADKLIAELHELLADGRAYAAARKADENYSSDTRLESLQDVIAGKLPVIVQADDVRQIQAAVAFAEHEKLKLIISGGYDAPRCAELLKKFDVPVIVTAVYRLPQRTGDPYDAAYSLPARLHEAGIRFCISASDRHASSNTRNLPYHAATAVAYGLPADEAIKAITLSPAQILGVAERVGSLEKGKDATLIVTDGDPLETATNVSAAFVQGRKVELNDRHKRLWQKYEEKYRRLNPAGK